MLRVLNDEEIRNCVKKAIDEGQLYGDDGEPLPEKQVAQTQFKQDIEGAIKWGEETCPHDLFGEGTQCFKHACDMCWEELKELIEE